MSRIRSVYLSDEEDEELVRTAEEQNMAINYVLRIALRALLGLQLSDRDQKLARN